MSIAPLHPSHATEPTPLFDELTARRNSKRLHPAGSGHYSDDRYGMMRIHIAQRRGDLACDRYTRNQLRAFATGHGVTPSSLRKRDLATRMAYEGLIAPNGYLRDGFPTQPGEGA